MNIRTLILAAAVAAMAVPAQAGLVSWWDFNDGAGSSTAADVVGGRTGTLTNFNTATDWVAGHTGGAGDFALDFGGTGNDDHVRVNSYKGVAGRAARTLSAWVKTGNSGNHDILSYGSNNNAEKFVFRVNNQNVSGGGKLRVEVNGGYQISDTDLSNNTWRHVVATWENDGSPNVNDVKLYLDGSLQGTGGVSGNNLNTNTGQNFWIGGESFSTRWFAGQMDDVAVWNRALTAGEIAQLAGGTAPSAIATVAPQAALDYNADLDASPTNGTWEDATNISGGHDWSINNNGGGARYVATTDPIAQVRQIDNAYTFNGTSDTATMATLDSFPGNPTNDSASFEMWFSPSDTSGQEILFETGGTGNGVSLAIDGTKILFTPSSASAATTGQLVFDGLTTDYTHVVGVIERTGAGADASLFVNGSLADSLSLAGFTDWAGTDNSGLGQTNGSTGGNNTGLLDGFGKFSGEIAVMRFYDTLLTPSDVLTLYAVPEPTTLLIWSLLAGLGVGLGWRRRK
jgi:hypothetical protein